MKMILAGFSVVYLAQVCPDLAQSWHERLFHKKPLSQMLLWQGF